MNAIEILEKQVQEIKNWKSSRFTIEEIEKKIKKLKKNFNL